MVFPGCVFLGKVCWVLNADWRSWLALLFHGLLAVCASGVAQSWAAGFLYRPSSVHVSDDNPGSRRAFLFTMSSILILFGAVPALVLSIEGVRLSDEVQLKRELVHAGEAIHEREEAIFDDLRRLQPDLFQRTGFEGIRIGKELWEKGFHNPIVKLVCGRRIPEKSEGPRPDADNEFCRRILTDNPSDNNSQTSDAPNVRTWDATMSWLSISPAYAFHGQHALSMRAWQADDGTWLAFASDHGRAYDGLQSITLESLRPLPRDFPVASLLWRRGATSFYWLEPSAEKFSQIAIGSRLLNIIFGIFAVGGPILLVSWAAYSLSRIVFGIETDLVSPSRAGVSLAKKLEGGKVARLLVTGASSQDIVDSSLESTGDNNLQIVEVDLLRAYDVFPLGNSSSQIDRMLITGLESSLSDRKTSQRAADCMEHLLEDSSLQVVLFCSVDPRPKLMAQRQTGTEISDDEESVEVLSARWESILSKFDVIAGGRFVASSPRVTFGQPQGNSSAHNVFDDLEREANGPWRDDLRNVISDLGTKLSAISRQDLIDQLVSTARPIYRLIWLALSTEEKLMLVHLARGKLANMRNDRVLSSLIKSRILTMDPYPRIATPSFEWFVRQAESEQTIAAWEKRSGLGAWAFIRLPFFAVIILGVMFLGVTAPQVFQSLSAIIVGAMAGVPLIVRLIASVGVGRNSVP